MPRTIEYFREISIEGSVYRVTEQNASMVFKAYPAAEENRPHNARHWYGIRARPRKGGTDDRPLHRLFSMLNGIGGNSPVIPKAIAYDRDEKNEYLLMKWVQGRTLASYIKDGKELGRPYFEAIWVYEMALSLVRGLLQLHQKSLYHGDLKPENLVAQPNGRDKPPRLVMIDFGSAWTGPETMKVKPTGTFGYAAPERINEALGLVDHRSDQFSVSVVLYEMLTGCLPYEGLGGMMRETTQYLPIREKNQQIWESFERVIERGLKYRPRDRFETTEIWMKALGAAMPKLGFIRPEEPEEKKQNSLANLLRWVAKKIDGQ